MGNGGQHVHYMIRADLNSVVALDADRRDAWGREKILATLADSDMVGMVAECPGGGIAGFVIYEMCPGSLVLHRLCGDGTTILRHVVNTRLNPARRETLTTTDPSLWWSDHHVRLGGEGAARVILSLPEQDRPLLLAFLPAARDGCPVSRMALADFLEERGFPREYAKELR